MALGSAEITCEDQGVRAVTVASGSQVAPVCKDQGVTKADDQEAKLPRMSGFAPSSEQRPSLCQSAQELVYVRAASDTATPNNVRSRAGLNVCCGNPNKNFKNTVSKLSNLLKKSASCAEVEGVTSAGAHGTAKNASVCTCARPSD